ncbi:MAG: sensor histidine kinase [Candidatus Kapaibacterium sp.]
MKINKKAWTIVIAATFVVQLIIITYNHFKGFVVLGGPVELVARLAIGTALASMVTIPALYANVWLVRNLSQRFPWERDLARRLLWELAGAFVIAAALSSALTVAAHLIAPYKDGLGANMINNFLIFAVANIIFVAIIESYIFFRDWKSEALRAEILEKENAIARYNNLKSQLNPHFLFNSLNTLSNLVYKDSELADTYLQEFARIYRYILDKLEKTVVCCAEELEFARSYIYLQGIRYGDSLRVEISIPGEYLEYFLPPMTMQLLLENCVKHNVVSADRPLLVRISAEKGMLRVENNYQKKLTAPKPSGIGLASLRRQYEYLTDRRPAFRIDGNSYIAEVPLIKPE